MTKLEKARKKRLEDAIKVATRVHENKVYMPGMPYINHCRRVAQMVAERCAACEVTGWLHDVVEDGNVTVADITEYFGSDIGDAIAAISRLPGEPYSTYIQRVKKNQIARVVKIADLSEHLFWGAGAKMPEKGYTLRPRYLNALAELLE